MIPHVQAISSLCEITGGITYEAFMFYSNLRYTLTLPLLTSVPERMKETFSVKIEEEYPSHSFDGSKWNMHTDYIGPGVNALVIPFQLVLAFLDFRHG
jgi:hypothetical protein